MGSIWSGLVWLNIPSCLLSRVLGDGANAWVAVIILIAAEILVAAINIVVDLYAGVD